MDPHSGNVSVKTILKLDVGVAYRSQVPQRAGLLRPVVLKWFKLYSVFSLSRLAVSGSCHYRCFTSSGALAMEALRRQVLPFILRRLKEDVLHDLPPKIIQDYYCDLSPLQVQEATAKEAQLNALSPLNRMASGASIIGVTILFTPFCQRPS